jgi:hypothetical protein
VTAVYVGDAAGFLHPGTSGLGVLMVPPFGWDDQSAYRPRRAWAQALAADGHTVLRLELPGTGDAAGSPRDADLPAAWIAAISDAARALEAERLAVIALGLGGLLTLAAGIAIDDLVLWGVPARGRAWVREFKAFAKLEASQTGDDDPVTSAGEIRAGGHVLTAETAAAIAALEGVKAVPGRALVLGRDGTPPDPALVEALGAETGDGSGWGAMLAGPQYAEVPTAVIERTRAWLPRPGGTARVPELPGAHDGETPLALPGGAFGVVTEPDGERRDLTLVFLNAGSIRHIGPNRMWVEAARRWAAQGVPSLRLDLHGIGEAEGAADPIGDDARYYVPELTAQVAPALDAVVARGLPGRFLLTGLCSGAYWALHTADADPRVAAAVLLNPRLLFWDPHAGGRRELRRALSVLTPAGFRRLLRAERPLARLLGILRWLVTRPLRSAEPPPSDLAALASRLAARGQALELAFSGEEPLHDELRRAGDDRHVTVHELPFRSHTLKPVGAQQAAHALLDAAIERALAQ